MPVQPPRPRKPLTRDHLRRGQPVGPLDVAATLNVDYVTVLRHIKDGSIPATRVGRRYFIPSKWLLDIVDGVSA